MDNSLFTEDLTHCLYCSKKAVAQHCAFNNEANHDEEKCRADGLVVPVCWRHNLQLHTDMKRQHSLRIRAQFEWERANPDGNFVKRYGRNYL